MTRPAATSASPSAPRCTRQRPAGAAKVLAFTGKGVSFNANDDPDSLLQSAINDAAGQIVSALNAGAPQDAASRCRVGLSRAATTATAAPSCSVSCWPPPSASPSRSSHHSSSSKLDRHDHDDRHRHRHRRPAQLRPPVSAAAAAARRPTRLTVGEASIPARPGKRRGGFLAGRSSSRTSTMRPFHRPITSADLPCLTLALRCSWHSLPGAAHAAGRASITLAASPDIIYADGKSTHGHHRHRARRRRQPRRPTDTPVRFTTTLGTLTAGHGRDDIGRRPHFPDQRLLRRAPPRSRPSPSARQRTALRRERPRLSSPKIASRCSPKTPAGFVWTARST